MSTDLTTSLTLSDDDTDDSLRVCRNSQGWLRIYAADGFWHPRGWLFSKDDAIMLRDWLNDEWPVGETEP